MITGFVESDSLAANELFALQSKRTLYTFRRQGKPITVLHSQKQMARLEPLNLGKRRFRETGTGTNDRTIFAGVADTLEHKLQSGVTRRVGPSIRFRVARGATLYIRWHHETKSRSFVPLLPSQSSFLATKTDSMVLVSGQFLKRRLRKSGHGR